MRITTKGQVTIPQQIRELAGFHPGTEVEFVIGKDQTVRVVAARNTGKEGADRLSAALANMRGTADVRLSTNDIMALTRG